MTLLKDVTDCSTYSVRGLDDQLIAQMNRISPGLLVRIDDINNVKLADAAVHPWMQRAAKVRLQNAVVARGKQIIINSAYRTLAGQMLLYQHYQNRRCGITAASTPGKSNHNNASAIDIEDSQGWRPVLQANGWRWIGSFDPITTIALIEVLPRLTRSLLKLSSNYGALLILPISELMMEFLDLLQPAACVSHPQKVFLEWSQPEF